MKKTKVIALVLCAAIMMMGAGYAYWTDTLTINNTVSTGELNVRFAGQNTTRGGDDSSNPYWGAYVKHEGRLGGPATVVSEDGKTVTTIVENMYPGAYAQYYGTVENNGTIPAVFDNVTVSFKGLGDTLTNKEIELKDNIRFAFGYKIVDKDGNNVTPNSGNMFWASGTLDQLQSEIGTLLANVKLEPTQKLLLDFPSEEDARAAMASIDYPYNDEMHCIGYFLSKNADDDIENQQLSVGITINWKQHNAN